MPRDIPITFSAPMVRLLLDGRKTMTRRLALSSRTISEEIKPKLYRSTTKILKSPWQKVEPGDRLWVRESLHADRMENFLTGERSTNAMVAYYDADDAEAVSHDEFSLAWKWDRKSLPSIHMPRSFSRLTLVVTATKIERLQNMSHKDAIAEGVVEFRSGETMFGIPVEGGFRYPGMTPQESFASLWTGLHGTTSWNNNPEVVALSFRVIKANIDAPEARAA